MSQAERVADKLAQKAKAELPLVIIDVSLASDAAFFIRSLIKERDEARAQLASSMVDVLTMAERDLE